MPEGTLIGKSVVPAEAIPFDADVVPAVEWIGLTQDGEEVVGSYTIDLQNLPEGTVIGKSVVPAEAVSGDAEVVSAVDVNSLMRTSAMEEVVDSYTIDLKNLPEGTVIGKSVVPAEAVSGDAEVVSAVDVNSLMRTSAIEEVVDSYTVDLKNLPEGTVIGKSVVPAEAVSGDAEVVPAVDVNSLMRTSAMEEVVGSYTVDLKNLPEGTVVGKSVVPAEAVSGDAEVVPAVDVNSLMRTSAKGEQVDLSKLPPGVVVSNSTVPSVSSDLRLLMPRVSR